MTIETASYVSQLNSSYPALNDPVEEGDNHIRLLKAVLLSTFPNMGAAVITTAAQLNALQYISTTNAPVLATNIAALSIGPVAGVHIAVGSSEIQAKSGAAATTLRLNKLGGSVEIGPQSGSGTVSIYHGAGLAYQSTANGAIIRDVDGLTPELLLQNNSNVNVAQLIYSSGLYLQALVNSATVNLNGYNSAGVQKALFSGDPNGNVTLYATGSVAFQATAIGVYVFSTSNDNPELQFYRSNKSTRNAFLIAATTGLTLVNEVHGTPISLSGEDNAGNLRSIFYGDPDEASQMFHAGNARGYTTANGWAAGSAANLSPDESASGHYQAIGNGYTGYWTLDANGMYLGHNSAVRDLFLRVNGVNRLQLKQGGDTSLLRDGADVLITAVRATYGSGGRVVDGAGNLQPIGFNCSPVSSIAAGQSLRVANAGFLFVATGTLTFTIDTTTDLAPNGSSWSGLNRSGGNLTLNPSGVGLIWANGTDGATGARTIAPYGFFQVIKESAGNYVVVGSGLS